MIYHDGKPIAQTAWRLSVPIYLVYVPLGAVFGVFFVHAGFPWFLAPLMSLLVYGGSVQFVAVGLLVNHASLFEIAVASLSLAFRNAFYGLNFLDRFQFGFLAKLYFIQSLVDSNYGTLSLHGYQDQLDDTRFALHISMHNQFAWVSGTCLGAVFANQLKELPGSIFMLVAFFVVMIYEYYCGVKTLKPLFYAAGAFIAAYYFSPDNTLLLAIAMSVVLLFFDKRLA